eukprot:364100-Chlamydomonas_euryale.AAC.39
MPRLTTSAPATVAATTPPTMALAEPAVTQNASLASPALMTFDASAKQPVYETATQLVLLNACSKCGWPPGDATGNSHPCTCMI